MACVTQRTSILVYVVFHLISSLVTCTRADVISECANVTTNVTTCIGTYADIYKSLASDENSFNIESALYPANEPSSVLVFVYIYGKKGSDKTADDSMPGVIKYTWSLRSLYAAFPAVFLEISSLFSIPVTSRTQELNITIPYFCCNVSAEDRKRTIKNVLAALQDLAVVPGLRDPRLNFAESVIEGHIADVKTTGLSYLWVVLWFSFLCPIFLGPLLYFWILSYLVAKTSAKSLSVANNGNRCRLDYICCKKDEDPLIRSVTFFCVFLLLIEVIIVSVRMCTSTEISRRGNMSQYLYFVPLVPILEWITLCCSNCLCCKGLDISSFVNRLLIIMCTSCVSYHFCWIAVGIMVNPAWGVSLLLLLSMFFIALYFVIFLITRAGDLCFSTFLACTPAFLGLCFFAVPPVLVGQSFYGRETADDVVKTVVLSVIAALLWLYYKSFKPSFDASHCVEAAKEAATAARDLAEKISDPKRGGTEVHSATVAAAIATSSSAVAAAAVALAAGKTKNSKPKVVQGENENSTSSGNRPSDETDPLCQYESAC